MKNRKTKQKEIIIKALKKDRSHPTITEIYEKISNEYPYIGKATVYRNVNSLVELGEIEKVADLTGQFHYDGNDQEHIHLICTNCQKIFDIYDVDKKEIISNITSNNSIVVENVSIICKGLCSKCQKLLSNNKEKRK